MSLSRGTPAITRLTSRIEDLAERRIPRRGPVNIVGADRAECLKRLEELEAAGQRRRAGGGARLVEVPARPA